MPGCLGYLCKHVHYSTFVTNLNLYIKKKSILKSPYLYICTCLSVIISGLLLSECEKYQIVILFISANPNFDRVANLALR